MAHDAHQTGLSRKAKAQVRQLIRTIDDTLAKPADYGALLECLERVRADLQALRRLGELPASAEALKHPRAGPGRAAEPRRMSRP